MTFQVRNMIGVAQNAAFFPSFLDQTVLGQVQVSNSEFLQLGMVSWASVGLCHIKGMDFSSSLLVLFAPGLCSSLKEGLR